MIFKDKKILNYLINSEKLLVGVSGGVDSIFLLDNLIKEGYSSKLVVAHVNHGFRKESFDEYNFVKNLCAKNNIIFEGIEFDILSYMSENNLTSDETVARDLRYGFYKDLMSKYNTNVILLGHHGDDLVEGVLMRLVRGASGRGLISMTKINDLNKDFIILRPLLGLTKDEIYKESSLRNLDWCEDASNKDNKYTRNRYRNNIIPLIKLENENVHKTILKYSETKNEEESYFSDVVESTLSETLKYCENDSVFYIEKSDLNSIPNVIKRRLLIKLLKDNLNINYVTNNILEIFNEKISNNKNTDYQLLLKGMYIVNSFDKVYFVREDVKFSLENPTFEVLKVDNNLFFNNKKVIKLLKFNKIPSAFRNYVYIENDFIPGTDFLRTITGYALWFKNSK